MPEYLSTDPDEGKPAATVRYISTDPKAGEPATGYERALAGADTIEETPWFARNFDTNAPARWLAEKLRPGAGAEVPRGLSLPSVTEQLSAAPSVGGAVGGAAGGAGGSVPGAVGGAALGGAAGESVRQLGMRALGGQAPATSLEAAKEIGTEAAKQGAAELGGRAAAGVVGRVVAPFPKAVDRPVLEAAARQGVDMPASALSKSKAVSYAEAYAGSGPFGGEVTKRSLEATGQLTAMADQTVARASKLTDDVARGEALAKGLDQFKADWIRTKNQLFGQVNRELPGLKVTAGDTVKLLDDVIAGKEGAGRILQEGPVADASFYRGLRDGLTVPVRRNGRVVRRTLKPVSAQDLQNALRELDAKIQTSYADPFAAANKGTLQKLSATLEEEFIERLTEKAPQTAGKLLRANQVYQEGITKINSTFGESIHKLAAEGKYDLIAKSIANPRMSVADVPRIMEVAGAEGSDAMRASVLADIVAKAKGADGRLTPQGLARAMKGYGEDRLGAILEPDQLSRLRDLATLSSAMERGAKAASGSPTAHIAHVAAYPNAAAAAVMGHPQALLFVLGDASFNRFTASRIGQRWLTTGFPLSGWAREGIKQTPRVAVGIHDVSQANEERP